MTDLVLDLPLLPPGGRRARHRLDQVVAGHLQEPAVVLPRLAGEDQLDRGLQVVVDPALAAAAPQTERPPVGIEHHLLGFAQDTPPPGTRASGTRRKCATFTGSRPTAQVDHLVAPVELIRLARREHQRHERGAAGATLLAPPAAGKAAHSVVAALVALPPQEIEQPLQRQPLPPRPRHILRQHRFQPADEQPQLRMRLLPTLVGELGRSRPDHLAHHLPRYPPFARDSLDALAPAEMLPPNPCNRLHHQHPQARPIVPPTGTVHHAGAGVPIRRRSPRTRGPSCTPIHTAMNSLPRRRAANPRSLCHRHGLSRRSPDGRCDLPHHRRRFTNSFY